MCHTRLSVGLNEALLMLSFDLQAWLLQSCDTVEVLLWILANLWLIPNSNQNKDKTLGFGLLKLVKDWLPSNARTIKINHLISHAYCSKSDSVFSIFGSTKPIDFKPRQRCWEIMQVLYHNARICGLWGNFRVKLIYIYIYFFEIAMVSYDARLTCRRTFPVTSQLFG